MARWALGITGGLLARRLANRARLCIGALSGGDDTLTLRPKPTVVRKAVGDQLETRRQVSFDYIKGNQFRTIHPDGAIGGLTPSGRIEVAFFCEREAIPQRVTYRLNEDGTLGDPIETIGRDAVVREMDVIVSLTSETAESLIEFLRQGISDATEASQKRTTIKTRRKSE